MSLDPLEIPVPIRLAPHAHHLICAQPAEGILSAMVSNLVGLDLLRRLPSENVPRHSTQGLSLRLPGPGGTRHRRTCRILQSPSRLRWSRTPLDRDSLEVLVPTSVAHHAHRLINCAQPAKDILADMVANLAGLHPMRRRLAQLLPPHPIRDLPLRLPSSVRTRCCMMPRRPFRTL